MRYAVIDTETTGMDPTKDRVIEIAAVWNRADYATSLVNPEGVPIEFPAMAVHHITDAMVAEAPPMRQALEHLGFQPSVENQETALVMHNAEFDRKFLPDWMRAFPCICTYRCALHLVPGAQSHGNGSLWHELGLARTMPEEAGNMPHRALFDAFMTFDLLEWMVDRVKGDDFSAWREDPARDPLEILLRLSKAPVVLKTCRFGKHRGVAWADVPSGYMEWVLGQDFDEDVKHTCRHWLTERGVPVI